MFVVVLTSSGVEHHLRKMADQLLLKNLSLLKRMLDTTAIDFELLSTGVITTGELQNIKAQLTEHGAESANNALLMTLLQKSTKKKEDFFTCLKKVCCDLYDSLEPPSSEAAKSEGAGEHRHANRALLWCIYAYARS